MPKLMTALLISFAKFCSPGFGASRIIEGMRIAEACARDALHIRGGTEHGDGRMKARVREKIGGYRRAASTRCWRLERKLKLPPGWTFEAKILTGNLTIDRRIANNTARIVRDELHDVYEGCGFDPASNYVP
jgi:hypothetical protein